MKEEQKKEEQSRREERRKKTKKSIRHQIKIAKSLHVFKINMNLDTAPPLLFFFLSESLALQVMFSRYIENLISNF